MRQVIDFIQEEAELKSPISIYGTFVQRVVRVSSDSGFQIGDTNYSSEALLYFDSETFVEFKGPFSNLAITDFEDLDLELLKTELQEICTQYSLPTSGTKSEILERIKQHLGIE